MTSPPLHLVAAYRLLGWRLGAAWREWVRQDLADLRSWRWRTAAWMVPFTIATLGGLAAGAHMAGHPFAWGLTGATIGQVTASVLFPRRGYEAALRRQRLRADGGDDPSPPGWWANLGNDQLIGIAVVTTLFLLGVGALVITTA